MVGMENVAYWNQWWHWQQLPKIVTNVNKVPYKTAYILVTYNRGVYYRDSEMTNTGRGFNPSQIKQKIDQIYTGNHLAWWSVLPG